MVTGNDFEEVRRELEMPTTHAEMHGYLLRNFDNASAITILEDVTVSELRDRDDLFFDIMDFDERTMILTVELPCGISDWHAVVVHKSELYDPGDVWHSLEELENVFCTWGFNIRD
jgi:hypothetical protein